MDKPMLVFKRFGHQIHLMVQKEAKRCGIEFMGGPQGQVVRFWIAVRKTKTWS